ncbi:hypothetical protein FE257_001447 [Aspergillus nanangensis]|uniref:Major facilitator superfamily (MFS) profile domain-containing protein n=1 Tax=Aspergillus nanangensis TaxID=2582783 RepID=A0AAD4CDW1_ASPNN|nr:hypothetical protein FE257_001447 [Aspergillus nanangensis]
MTHGQSGASSASQAENLKCSNSETSAHLENVSPTPPHPPSESLDSWVSEDPNHPRNWPKWKKNAQILMVAFHSMSATFMAAGIIPAYDDLAKDYGVTVPEASYLTSIQILLLGLVPFFWKPITSVYGRYHVFLFSAFGCMICNIGGARCTSYGAQMVTRILVGILISPPMGIGSGVITELCEPEERAQKIGWWTLMLTLGTPSGPFIMGFVSKHLGYEWIFWLFAIMNFIQVIVYLWIGEETMVPADNIDYPKAGAVKRGFFSKMIPRRLDSRPLRAREFIEPLFMSRYSRVIVPAIAHSIVFCYGNIALIVEMPIAMGEKFKFDAQQIGLQFIAIIIGCVLGEQLSGPMSDWFMKTMSNKRGQHRPADRLWLSYIGFGTVICGLLVWGFQLDKATTWNVTPCVGAAIASFGNQIITTIMISYAVDSHRDQSTNVGVCINLYRHVWGFIGPFYFPHMFETLKFAGAAGVMCAIIAVVALIPIIAIQFMDTRSSR